MYSRMVSSKMEHLYDSMEEFKALNPDTVVQESWKTADEGSWVLTDDNQVCRILRRLDFKPRSGKKNKEYIRTLLGTIVISPKATLKGKPVRNIYSFSKDKYADAVRRDRKEPTKGEIIFAKYVSTGLPPEEAYMKAFKTNNRQYAKNISSKLIKSERIQKLVTEEMKEALDKVGVDPQYLLEKSKYIIDKEEARDSDKLRAIETLMKVAGMFPAGDKKTESLTVFQGFSQEQLDQLKNAEVKALAHASRENSNG